MNLFKKISVLTALIAASVPALATIWTVSNNADRPAQFTVIQDAVNAASPGDTLLITGGTYTGFTMVKNLVMYGEAIEGSEFPTTNIAGMTISKFNSSLGCDGSRFYGIRWTGAISINPTFSGAAVGQRTLDDIIFERCEFAGTSYNYPYDGTSNVTFRNCFFRNGTWYFNWNGINPAPVANWLITNCVFENFQLHGNSTDYNGNLVIRNSIFMDRTSNCFGGAFEWVLENNIFYAAEPGGLNLSTWNNNLTYLCNSNTIPYGDNIGSGNIINQNPSFVNYPALGGDHSWAYDYSLQAGSPALGTGTNGSDIGIGGGNAPVANLPRYAKIPGVYLLDIPVSSVPVGGTLQINVEAESRD